MLKAIRQTGTFDVAGLKMSYSAEQNSGLDQVFLTVIQPDGTFKPVDKLVKLSKN